MNNTFIKYWIFALIILLFFSCKNTERASRKFLEGNNTEYLLSKMSFSELNFNTLSAKADVKVNSDKRKASFKANLRIQKDSIIWISITPLLGIEMARVLITEDSVKVIDRLNKEYFLGNFEYINKKFNVELEFEVIQSLLVGNKIIFEPDKDLKFAIDKDQYYIGNLKKRKAKKVDENPQKIERRNEEIVSFWLNSHTFKITELILTDLSADRFIKGTYNKHETINEQLFPMNLDFTIQSENPSQIEIDYSRVEIDEETSYPFNISSKYERVYY